MSKRRRGRPPSIGETEFAIPVNTEMTGTTKLDQKVPKLLLAVHKNRLRAQFEGDAVEPRTVVLKLASPRRKHG